MKILIVDDHPLIREGLGNVLRELDPSADVHEADSAEGAMTRLAEHPDLSLALLDLSLPGAHGMSLLERFRREAPHVPVVVLSAWDDRQTVMSALEREAMGFISKRSPTQVLVNALKLVLVGGISIPPHSGGGAESGASPLAASAPLARSARDLGLTDRQLDVLALLVQGKPNKLICRELDLADGTVKTHIQNIYRVLGVGSRTEALFKLNQMGVQIPQLLKKRTPALESSHHATRAG